MKQQKSGWQQYRAVDINTGVEGADPHRLIQMLYDAALDSIAVAYGCMDRNDTEGKGLAIGKAIGLVGGLRDSLKHDIVDGGLADNLSSLYEFVTMQLAMANSSGDKQHLNQARDVLLPLKSGWDGIRSEAQQPVESSATLG